jgi:hypothetical protein
MTPRAPSQRDEDVATPLSKDGAEALGRALRAHLDEAGRASQERAALALGEALSRERKVVDLFSRPPSAGPARLAASAHGDEEVLLRVVPGGGFLLCSEGERLWVEWRGRGAATLSVSRGWKAERQVRRRGGPLRWTLLRTGRVAGRLPSVSAVVGGKRWTLWRSR